MSKKRALVMAVCVGVTGFVMNYLTDGNDLWVRALATAAVVGVVAGLFTVRIKVERRDT